MPLEIGALSDIPMVGRPRPFIDHFNKAVFDGIVMDIIYVPLEVGFIADLVLPESPLPYPSLSLVHPGQALGQILAPLSQVPMGNAGLDARPSTREVSICLRKFPYRMQVVGEEA
jgi:hypothetical protein